MRLLACVVLIVCWLVLPASGHVSLGLTWPMRDVSYRINPRNDDGLAHDAVIAAIQRAANAWPSQSGADITLTYAGLTTGASFAYNQINEVFFRPEAPPAIAETYLWSIGNTLMDVDIVFYDAGSLFFIDQGCSNGYYLEDTGAHEFGHFIGLAHSDVLNATMFPRSNACDNSLRVLDADDLAGARALYGTRTWPVPLAPINLRIVKN